MPYKNGFQPEPISVSVDHKKLWRIATLAPGASAGESAASVLDSLAPPATIVPVAKRSGRAGVAIQHSKS